MNRRERASSAVFCDFGRFFRIPTVLGCFPETGKIRPFWGRLLFFGRSRMPEGVQKKKKETASTQKTLKISKKLSPAASDTAKVRVTVPDDTYGTEEVFMVQ